MQGKEGISKYTVTQPHKAPEGATNLSTKVSFELDLHGLVRCNGVVQNHKIEVEEPAPVEAKPAEAKPAEAAAAPADAEMKDAAAGADGAEAPAAAEAENGDASNMEAQDTAPEPPKMIKKTKKVRQSVASCLVHFLLQGQQHFAANVAPNCSHGVFVFSVVHDMGVLMLRRGADLRGGQI